VYKDGRKTVFVFDVFKRGTRSELNIFIPFSAPCKKGSIGFLKNTPLRVP